MPAYEIFLKIRQHQVIFLQQAVALAKFGRRRVLGRKLALGRPIAVTLCPSEVVDHRALADCDFFG
ncbi:MAG TPA: hypothetical protein VEJ16_17025 [Alphaproteobacteria bacterium]|nr:hypothetical protein [Alphaproteobacteria bacterium]